MRYIFLVVLALAVVLPAAPQTRSRRQPSRQSSAGKDTPPGGALPSFSGTIRKLDAKKLELERPDSNVLQFFCSRKTKYYDGPKQIKPSALKPGDQVTVETKEGPDGSLDAVNVRKSVPEPPSSPPQSSLLNPHSFALYPNCCFTKSRG